MILLSAYNIILMDIIIHLSKEKDNAVRHTMSVAKWYYYLVSLDGIISSIGLET